MGIQITDDPVPQPRGIGGWLVGFLASLLVGIGFYALTAYLITRPDSDISLLSIPGMVTLTTLVSAILGFVLMLAKSRDGILMSKIFFTLNASIWLYLTVVISHSFLTMLFLSVLYGAGSSLYLDKSVRVRNTYEA